MKIWKKKKFQKFVFMPESGEKKVIFFTIFYIEFLQN